MEELFYQRLDDWNESGEHQQVVDFVLSIPPENRDYRLNTALARAYLNMEDAEHWEKAARLLLSLKEEGKEDYNWYIRVGGAMARLLHDEEAETWFKMGLSLLPPDSPEYREVEDRCQLTLRLCRSELARKEAWERYQDSLDPEKALDFVLNGLLHNGLEVEDTVEGSALLLPDFGVRVFPEVEQLKERGAVLNFWLDAPQWGKRLFECSAAMGEKPGQALAAAVHSFIFSFLEGVTRMERQIEPREILTTFAGRVHRWALYPSNIVGMGACPSPQGQVWWEALGEDIKKRLGNQRLCYVKIYGAKINGEVTGECRIDDIKSEELSEKVARLVDQWDDVPFASQKQFFFLRQEEETRAPYPYDGIDGQARLRDDLVRAVKLFHACRGEEDYDSYVQRLADEIGDGTLAEECLAFLPELCAAHAFPQLPAAETVELCRDGRPKEVVYKNQLADYYPLWIAFFQILREGTFGDETDAIYREFVGYSSTYQVIQRARKKGSRLEDCRLTALLCQVDRHFEIR